MKILVLISLMVFSLSSIAKSFARSVDFDLTLFQSGESILSVKDNYSGYRSEIEIKNNNIKFNKKKKRISLAEFSNALIIPEVDDEAMINFKKFEIQKVSISSSSLDDKGTRKILGSGDMLFDFDDSQCSALESKAVSTWWGICHAVVLDLKLNRNSASYNLLIDRLSSSLKYSREEIVRFVDIIYSSLVKVVKRHSLSNSKQDKSYEVWNQTRGTYNLVGFGSFSIKKDSQQNEFLNFRLANDVLNNFFLEKNLDIQYFGLPKTLVEEVKISVKGGIVMINFIGVIRDVLTGIIAIELDAGLLNEQAPVFSYTEGEKDSFDTCLDFPCLVGDDFVFNMLNNKYPENMPIVNLGWDISSGSTFLLEDSNLSQAKKNLDFLFQLENK